MRALNNSFLRGSFPPLVTPFRSGKVDYNKFAELVERQVQQGSHGVVVAGTTGEPSSLSVDERTELLKVAVSVISTMYVAQVVETESLLHRPCAGHQTECR